MDMISVAIPSRARLSSLKIISSALFFLFAVLSAISAFTMTQLHWRNFQELSIGIPYVYPPNFIVFAYFELFRLANSILAPVLALLATLSGLVSKRRWQQSLIGIGLFIIVFLSSWVWQWCSNIIWIFQWTQNLDLDGFRDTLLGWISLICGLLAVIVSIVASILSPPKIVTGTEYNAPEAKKISPVSDSPISLSTPQNNLNNLPLFALIGAFVIPLAGIILGHLSLNYMKKGQLSDQNQGMAKIGLILGYVFVGLSFIVGLVVVVAIVVTSINRGY